MRLFAMAGILTAWFCPLAAQTAVTPGAQEITVPAGTRIALRLTDPIDSMTAKTGDTVHARVAFPVAVGNTVAIPPETYVDGAIDNVTRRGRHAGFRIHFKHLIFSSGYTVSLPAAAADTRAAITTTSSPMASHAGPPPPMSNSVLVQPAPMPTPAPLSMPRPNMGAIIGLTVGAAAAGVITVVALAHRGVPIRLEADTAIDMTLQTAISLDAAQVAAAFAIPARQ